MGATQNLCAWFCCIICTFCNGLGRVLRTFVSRNTTLSARFRRLGVMEIVVADSRHRTVSIRTLAGPNPAERPRSSRNIFRHDHAREWVACQDVRHADRFAYRRYAKMSASRHRRSKSAIGAQRRKSYKSCSCTSTAIRADWFRCSVTGRIPGPSWLMTGAFRYGPSRATTRIR
jgi:hypothetical protein